jgi:hypothetical protein
MRYNPKSDRRTLLGSGLSAAAFAAGGALMGAGPAHAAVKKIPGASLKGPYLDLTTARGNMMAVARLSGNIDMKTTVYGWYDGIVMGVAPGGPVRNICGFKGMSCKKMIPTVDGEPGYRRLLREVGYYYDLATGEILEEMVNPYTDEKVKVVHVNNDPFNTTIRETVPPGPTYGGLNAAKREPKPLILEWKIKGDRLLMERHIHLYYKNALDPAKWPRESSGQMVQVSEFFFHNMSLDDMQNEDVKYVSYGGTWSRITPWLPWMLMGQAPGNCNYQCFMGGFNTLAEIPEDIVRYTEKNFPKFLTAPDTWEEPSLSSIEHYSRTQKPAPIKGGA